MVGADTRLDRKRLTSMYGGRAKIGFMIPSSCLVLEQEFLQISAGLEGVIGVPARLLITACDAAELPRLHGQSGTASTVRVGVQPR